ncbi:MAG: hypothetical protein KAR05_01025 [Candidatus Omnitrophica bacterium]|nr:hypothetical protein [Candidatus Omnitrophota bacterium]
MGRRYSLMHIYLYSFLLAFCSLIYELLIAQTFALFAANTVICYSLTIGLYLGAMGAGAFFWKRIFKHCPVSKALFNIEAGMSLLGALSVIVIYVAHMLYGYMWLRYCYLGGTAIFFGIVFLLIAAIGFFTGMEVPVLIVLAKQESDERGNIHRVLGADYFGCLLGGIFFPLVLLPHLGLLRTAFVVALINCLVAFHILCLEGRKGSLRGQALLLPAAVTVLIISGMVGHQSLEQYFLKKYYYYKHSAVNGFELFLPTKNLPDIERKTSRYHNIDMVKIKSYNDPFTGLLIPAYSRKRWRPDDIKARRHVMYLNGDFQFWTDFEEIYHEYFTHVPIIINKRVPGRVLILGGGDGMLARELLKYEEVKSIDLVDIDRQMITLAKTHPVVSTINRHAFDDPRVKIQVGDAYQFIRREKERYDAIYIDFPNPKDYDLSKLYSVEFYHGVQRHLNENGFAVMDAPGLGAYPRDKQKDFLGSRQYRLWQVFLATLKAAGFKTVAPYVSNLERDNKWARNVLYKRLQDITRLSVFETDIEGRKKMNRIYDKDEMVRKIIEGYVGDQRKGFIFLKSGEEDLDYSYWDRDISHYVLNKERFLLAFDVPYKDEDADAGKVNSVMRPTLPERAFWWRIRMPN